MHSAQHRTSAARQAEVNTYESERDRPSSPASVLSGARDERVEVADEVARCGVGGVHRCDCSMRSSEP